MTQGARFADPRRQLASHLPPEDSVCRDGLGPSTSSEVQTGWRAGPLPLLPAVVDRPRDLGLEVLAAHDAVDEPVLQEELAGLEALG